MAIQGKIFPNGIKKAFHEERWKLEAVNGFRAMKIVHVIKATLSGKRELIPNIEEENNFFQDTGSTKNKHSIKVKKYKPIGGN